MKTEGLVSRALTRRVAATTLVAAGLVAVAPVAFADDYDTGGFEAFSYGDPAGQNGWTANDLGVYAASNFDIDIVDPSPLWGTQLGSHALRFSNAVTSNGFGNQLQTPSLADAAGETTADPGSLSGGARQSRLSGTITFASATQAYQPGLRFTFAADRGDGARMANFRITDEAGGFKVEISTIDESLTPDPDFVYFTIASGLSHTELHTLQFSLDFVEGDNNDVLWVKVDESGCSTFDHAGSWEQYHKFYAGNLTPVTFTADSILFRASGTAQPSLLGGGVLFDTFKISSSTVPAMPGPGVPHFTSAPIANANGHHVKVSHSTAAANACQPVITYSAKLTPQAGGNPITLTSATPDFDFDAVPAGLYSVTLSATNAAGTSDESAPAPITVAAETPDPGAPDEEDGGELAESGAASLPLALVALGLVSLGVVTRRFAISRN